MKDEFVEWAEILARFILMNTSNRFQKQPTEISPRSKCYASMLIKKKKKRTCKYVSFPIKLKLNKYVAEVVG